MTNPFIEALDNLPIRSRKNDILASVQANQVTIITAETGAGKSTQVPQYLAEAGFGKVIVTQPRILAARNLCTRVREEYSWRSGVDAENLVGYHTANERDDSPENRILYCTDGLQLVRELTGSGTRDRQILVLDEVHEWNENMEVLVAWAKKRCQEDPHFKVVLMSATIETDSLSAYFGAPAPITVGGRTFPVDKLYGGDLVAEILKFVDSGPANLLVFLPGKTEIENIAQAVRVRSSRRVPIIPLHGQLDAAAQQLAFGSYPSGKVILTTNVAQTSITIDDIDVVIDSGLERRAEVRSGVEGLFIAEISQADCLQRAGRAGRTKPGVYVLAKLDKLPCSTLSEREPYGVPEIMRKHIDRIVLRLANIGIDIETLDFYHSPSRRTIKNAKRTLVALGALTSSGGVTDIGRGMERFPVESTYARMLVEAAQYPADIQTKLAAIIAIQEVGGIVKGNARYTGWRHLTRNTTSDLLAQFDVYLALDTIDPGTYDDLGIIARGVTKAREVNARLIRDLGLTDVALVAINASEAVALRKCIVAGQLHQIWTLEPNGEVVHITSKQRRELSNGTVVKQAKLVTGTPFDLEVATPKGLDTLHLLNDVTALDPQWLADLAPNTFEVMPGKVYFDSHYGTLAQRRVVKSYGRTLESAGTPLLDKSPENHDRFVLLYSQWLRERINHERKSFELFNTHKVPEIPLSQVRERVEAILETGVSLAELSKTQRLQLEKLAKLETYLGSMYRIDSKITKVQALQKQKQRRSPWKPPHKRARRGGRG